MTGDGELQEGQNWRRCRPPRTTASAPCGSIVDRNELQSDKPTDEILGLGDLEAKLRAFGWQVARCDGHDHAELRRVFAGFRDGDGLPKVLVAETMKGKGVSFMEHPRALAEGGGTYRWHAGAPDDEVYARRMPSCSTASWRAELLGVELPPLEQPPLEEPVAVSLQGEPEGGAWGAPAAERGVRRRCVRRGAGGAGRDHRPARRVGRRSRLGLPGARLRGGVSGAVPRDRHRRAGHGLGRSRDRSPRSAPGGELVCQLSRVARERADLQPGQRADEGRLRPPLRRAHPGGPRQVAPVGARHLAPRRVAE